MNTIGHTFRVTTFGESHGVALGAVIDGCPAKISLTEKDINGELKRRRPGQSKISTARQENDVCEIVSGIFEGKTTGMPITVLVRNTGQRSTDYKTLKNKFRAGHADKVFQEKYGIRDYRGGGRSSGRETIGRVIGGAIAKKVLPKKTEIFGHIIQIGDIRAEKFVKSFIENNPVRCADVDKAKEMEKYILKLKKSFDSTGGMVEVRVLNPPPHLGEPVFDKLKADLAKAVMSIGAVTGFSYGAGFETAEMKGSHYVSDSKHFGGILGGIATGEDIVMRVSIKPTASVGEVAKKGRHDPCIAPRVIPVIESMVAITLADQYLRNKIYSE
jgi:chorismate synthase